MKMNKKGISPLIGTALLVVIIVIMVLLIMSYVSRTIDRELQEKAKETNKTSEIYFKSYNSTDVGLQLIRRVSYPTSLEFHADRILFTDKELTITFTEFDSNKVYFMNFDNYDKIIWNIGNRSWTYVKEVKNGR